MATKAQLSFLLQIAEKKLNIKKANHCTHDAVILQDWVNKNGIYVLS